MLVLIFSALMVVVGLAAYASGESVDSSTPIHIRARSKQKRLVRAA